MADPSYLVHTLDNAYFKKKINKTNNKHLHLEDTTATEA